MGNSRHRQYGVTLIEVVVVLAVLAVVVAVMNRPLSRLIQTRADINAASTREADINFALARMATEIRLSSGSESITSCDEGTLTIGGTPYKTGGTGATDLVVGPDSELLIKSIGTFSCSTLDAGLRLYRLVITMPDGESYSVRAFKRASDA